MERDVQILELLQKASDLLESQGDFLVLAQLSQPIATLEARLANTQLTNERLSEDPEHAGSAAN